MVGVKGERRIDGVVLTFVATPRLGNDVPWNYPSSAFGNLSDNAGI